MRPWHKTHVTTHAGTPDQTPKPDPNPARAGTGPTRPADHGGSSRTKSDKLGRNRGRLGPVWASRGKLRSTGTNREWRDAMLGAKPEPNRSQIGTRPAQIGARLETGRSPAGARLGQGRGKAGTSSPLSRSDRRSGWHRQPAPATCIGLPYPTAQSGDWSEKPDRAGVGARTGLVRAGKGGDKPALTDGCFGPPDGLISPFAGGVRVVWRGTMAAKFDCSVRSGSQLVKPDREAGLENGPENGS